MGEPIEMSFEGVDLCGLPRNHVFDAVHIYHTQMVTFEWMLSVFYHMLLTKVLMGRNGLVV